MNHALILIFNGQKATVKSCKTWPLHLKHIYLKTRSDYLY